MPATPNRRRLALAPLGFVIAIAVLAACGGDDDTGAEPTTPQGRVGATVTVDRLKYDPAQVEIGVGEAVRWKFEDSVAHNVKGPDIPKSKTFTKGEHTYTFERAGTFPYICTLHPFMKATVVVT